jgi:carboxypeptidase T
MPLRFIAAILALCFFSSSSAQMNEDHFWLELRAENKKARNHIVDLGFDIVTVEKDRVIVFASESQLQLARQTNLILGSYRTGGVTPFDFPAGDQQFHNYPELTAELNQLAVANPDILELATIGVTNEKREIWGVRVSAIPTSTGKKLPGALFVGGHHAREHVSIEVPLRLLNYLVDQYNKKDPRIVSLLNSTEILIVPLLNPDGAEFDIATGVYQSWRKNRRPNSNGSVGVDLNRNYSVAWGTTGASANPGSDTYRGASAFSELETQAFKKFVETHSGLTTMISYHTFGENVLWPWSYSDDEIPNAKDLAVFKAMAAKMGKWTGYSPMKSGDLYLSSGDTCDWAYAEQGIFAFTFELDPQSPFDGGFYPAQSVLDTVFKKNLESALYMIESAANPYKAAP